MVAPFLSIQGLPSSMSLKMKSTVLENNIVFKDKAQFQKEKQKSKEQKKILVLYKRAM